MTDQPSQREPVPERSPWSRPSVLLSAAFLLALVLLGILVAAAGGGSQGSVQPTPPPTGQPPANAATTASGATGCALPASDQSVPATSPPPARWETVGSMETPQAPSSLGPAHVDGVWNTCFAHSPNGALLAAFNLWAEGTAAAPSDVFRHLAVGAPANLGNEDRLDAEGPVQFAGYRYESYQPSTAKLMVVIKGPQGALEAVGTTMRWVDGDWKYVFPPSGTPALQTLPDLTGYVQWSAF